MGRTINDALKENRKGFYIGHRLILPFKCQILKIIFHNEIFTELVGGKHIKLNQDPKNTSVYIRTAGKLTNFMNTYEVVKMIVAEMDADLTDPSTHIKIICEIKENHEVNIHLPSEDMLFIE